MLVDLSDLLRLLGSTAFHCLIALLTTIGTTTFDTCVWLLELGRGLHGQPRRGGPLSIVDIPGVHDQAHEWES